MEPEMVSLKPNDLSTYRKIIDGYERKRLNEGGGDGRILFSLWPTLEKFLREKYEGRSDNQKTYNQSDSVMASAFARVVQRLVKKKRRPLVFADTAHEADFLLRVLRSKGIDACTWSEISSKATTTPNSAVTYDAIVANKKIEGSGLNLQRHADAIICRPTPGDHLEQMKGRIDRPGQTRRELLLVVVVAEHTIEECKFANIHLAGNFFREYIAPVATRYKERKDKVDLSATLSVGGTKKLSRGTVTKVWRQALADAGQSGAFANVEGSLDETSFDPGEDLPLKSSKKNSIKDEPKYKPLNKVLRNKGDPVAVKEAKERAMNGHTSPIIRNWLFPSKATSNRPNGKPKLSFERFNDTTPPLVLDRPTIEKAAAHLSLHDEKLASLIARVGVDALVIDCGTPCTPTQAGFFDTILRSIAFTMVSVDAGNAFMRRLAMKVGVCLEGMPHKKQKQALEDFAMAQEGNITPEEAMNCLIEGRHNEIRFSHEVMKELVEECEVIEGKRTGYPHICGVTHPCGKHDDPKIFLSKARDQSATNGAPVSAGFSRPKAEQIIDLVKDFVSGKVSAQRIAAASDRQAAKMLMELNGIGDWGAGEVLMHNLKRADIMLYGDLTVRNYLNDLYDINHQEDSETWLESAADFPDTGPNRNLMDSLSEKNNWGPYRSLVCYLMYHMAEENLVLL
jgi:3-methyladenine DNA glycosylase/8-oxoguanine DNA glycosylase